MSVPRTGIVGGPMPGAAVSGDKRWENVKLAKKSEDLGIFRKA